MVPFGGCHFTLKIFSTVFIMVVTATWDQERHPVGPVMCKYHCGQFTACTFCIFLIRRLTCIATRAKYPPQTNGEEAVNLNFTKERQGSISERKEICEDSPSTIVLTRSNDFRCIKLRTEENTRLLVVPRRKENTRLLVVPRRSTKKTPLLVVNLLNGSTTTYHHIKIQHVIDIAYVATLRQVIVASYGPMKLRAFSLHTSFSATVRRNIFAQSIAVDDSQQLVFLVVRSPFYCVTSMSPDGRSFKRVTCRDRPYLLCLDRKREILYVVGKKYIWSFTYTGQSGRIITKSGFVECLTLGEKGDVMYYIDNYNIVQFELFGAGKKVNRVYFHATCILFNKGYYYMCPRRNKYIQVWHDGYFSRLRGANPTGVTSQLIALAP